MYLAEAELIDRIPAMGIEVPQGFALFDPTTQVQPCSIDLRLGSTFWIQNKSRELDLLSARHRTPISRRDWDKHVLSPGESIKLKPGQLILGHTLERFSIPADLAGKLEGKSSYSRLGISIHASADFINPGWSGRMPLPLVSNNTSTLRLYAGMPICQLMLVPLTSVPLKAYGDPKLSSKYTDDDGGPSYWWKDRHLKSLMTTMGNSNYSIAAQQKILELLDKEHYDFAPILDRLEEFLTARKGADVSNVDSLLFAFVSDENRRARNHRWASNMSAVAVAVFGAGLLSVLIASDIRWPLVAILSVLTAGSAAWVLWMLLRESPLFLTSDEYHRLRQFSPPED